MQTLKQRSRIMSFIPDARDRRRIQNRRYAILAFLIPFLVLFLAYAVRGVFPFGNRHILTVDIYHQYAPFMAVYRDKILSGGSPFYSFAGGLGFNFYALFAYYLASPFNLLLLIFPPSFLTEAVLLITLLKIGLAGWAFHFFLRTAFQRRGYLAIAFSSFYALSGFTMAYAWNVMWLDTLIWLPIVFAALIRLMRDGRWILYPVALTMMIVSHFYTAYMACLFIALMFPLFFLRSCEKFSNRKKLLVFLSVVGLTILAVAITAVIIYPTWESLKLTSAAGDTFPKPELEGQPLNYLGQLFPFLEPTVRSGAPNIYCGVIILLLLPMYVVSGRIRLRDKILNMLVFFLLLLSFDFNVLNFVWHGMHYPNQLPHRFSFVVVFFILTLAYEAMRSVSDFSRMEIGLVGLALSLAVPVVTALVEDIKAPSWVPWATIFFILMYVLSFLSLRTRKTRRRLMTSVLFSIMLLEIILSAISGISWLDNNEYYGSREGYTVGEVPSSIRQAATKIDELENGNSLFYRTEVKPHKTSNDPALYGLQGLSLFASTSPESSVPFFKNLGYQNNGINSYQYRGSTLFCDALFSIRYVIEREDTELIDNERPVVLGNQSVTVYENPYAFPLAFACSSNITSYRSSYSNPFKTQNELSKAISGEKHVMFRLLEPTIELGGGELSATSQDQTLFHFSRASGGISTYELLWITKRSGPHYLNVDFRGHAINRVEADVDGRRVSVDKGKKGITELGSVEKGASIRLTIKLESDAKTEGEFVVHCASLDIEHLKEISRRVEANRFTLSSFYEDRFFGIIRAEQDGHILLSIPYDPGWSAKINGEPVEIEVIDGALMTLPVKQGEHTLSMNFVPVGFFIGLYISVGALAILIILLITTLVLYYRKKAKNDAITNSNHPEEEERLEDDFFQELIAQKAEMTAKIAVLREDKEEEQHI